MPTQLPQRIRRILPYKATDSTPITLRRTAFTIAIYPTPPPIAYRQPIVILLRPFIFFLLTRLRSSPPSTPIFSFVSFCAPTGAMALSGTRAADHAGSWYTSDDAELSDELDGWLDSVPASVDGHTLPIPGARAVIAPWVFPPPLPSLIFMLDTSRPSFLGAPLR